ncbi:MAG: UvrD-helicase domain-containing protein [Bacteroidaceae bacterium]|nr:UvrD-helicase domain-containing protein [Bacteroidaceae bacterium]
MKRFITAGAGSGKTYTVTTEVARRVKEEGLCPEQVIMTTFTKAAAQELREKAKKELIKIGLPREAQQMEHALIGTVHSVANTFLTKYWYLLGIMPDACALEEDELQIFRDQSLRGILTKADKAVLYRYCEKYNITYSFGGHKSGFNYEFWKGDLCSVLDYMQWYNITDEQLDKSLNETTESFVKLLDPKEGVSLNNPPIDLCIVYNALLDTVNAARKSAKKEKQLEFLMSLDIHHPSVDDVKQLADIIMDRKLGESYKDFLEWSSELINFPADIATDHREYAKIIFRLAKDWRSIYRKFKDEHHLIDFNDMEEMFLQLLNMDEVREDIQARYSTLYVDEFQDSNPMQVRIFQKLSELIDTCYVGDKKQAIYGFRGSDTELTTAVADSIEEKQTLEHSYRSIEPLVNFSNAIFSKVFEGMGDVTLKMPEENGNYTPVASPLRLWQWGKDKDLALQIQQLILREGLDCKDVAVLARNNSDLDDLAEELRELDIPVCRENDNIKDSRTGRLIKALLTLMMTPYNMLARAEVAYLTEPGYHVTRIIEERLDNLALEASEHKHYLKSLPILQRLFALRSEIKAQSVSAMLESMIIECDLYALVHRWENANAEETNLQVFIDLARKYEESATRLARPATVAGFIEYFCNQCQKGAADNSGVRLYTYHKSKGLEWKVVIMLSLDQDAQGVEKIAKRCVLGCHNHREQLPTPECPNPPMTISLVRNVYTSGRSSLSSAIISRLQQHPRWEAICEAEKQEQARLLYVGVTRARNILILAAKGKEGTIDLNWFRSTGLDSVQQTLTDAPQQDVLGIGIPVAIERLDLENLMPMPQQEQKQVIDIAAAFSALDHFRDLSPSHAGTTPHELGRVLNDKEQRIPETVAKDREAYARMGDFIHQVFCCMDDGIGKEAIEALRSDYGFTPKNMPQPEMLINAWHFLVSQLEQTYGKAVRRIHEMPFRHLDDGGHYVSGFIDFVWETEDAYIVVDYKTCASNYAHIFRPKSEHYAGRHGDQLDCYQRALEADGKKTVKARLIYYPVTGFLVEVK